MWFCLEKGVEPLFCIWGIVVNPIFIDGFEFVPARFSCGFDAIYNATKHLGYEYYEHQLYYLGVGMNFDYICIPLAKTVMLPNEIGQSVH